MPIFTEGSNNVIDFGQAANRAQALGVISKGYTIEALTIHDLIIDIAGIYFPLRTMQYTKNMQVDEEYGSGSRLPWALTDKQIGWVGRFEFAGYLKNGEPALQEWQRLALTALLMDQDDEGQPLYFNIIFMNRSKGGKGPDTGDFLEALLYCKVTTEGRNVPENNDVITSYDFKAMARLPK